MLQKENQKTERTILAITDFTKSSTNAILFAAHLFKNSNLKFEILHAFGNPIERESLLIYIEDILAKKSETGLKNQSYEIAAALPGRTSSGKNAKFNIATHSVNDISKKAISNTLQLAQVDLIVVGIPSYKKPGKKLNNLPLLLMGQSKYPVLLVPEESSAKQIKNALILNFGSFINDTLGSRFETIVNHDHLSKHIIQLGDTGQHTPVSGTINNVLIQEKTDLIILNAAAGDKLDRALLDYNIQELPPIIISMLNN